MNERQRQDYLEAMGIQPWFPRVILPGAKPSVTCEWDYESDPIALPVEPPPPMPNQPVQYGERNLYEPAPASLPVSHKDSAPKTSSAILSELGYAEKQAPVITSESSDTDAATETVEVIETAAPFRITAVDVSEHILAVVDLPWSGGITQFSNMHHRLLSNIIKALNLPSDLDWKHGLFAWPLLPEAVPIHRRYAKEAVRAYLTNQFGLKRRKIILLFGRTSTAYLWDETQGFDESRGTQERDGIHYGMTYSLGELMNIPSLKAEAWANLKPLRTLQTRPHTTRQADPTSTDL